MPTLCFYRQEIVQTGSFPEEGYFTVDASGQRVTSLGVELGSTVEFAVPEGSLVASRVEFPDGSSCTQEFLGGQEPVANEGTCFGQLVLQRLSTLEV